MSNDACRNEHEFTLVLSGINEVSQQTEDALFEAGCDDSTVSVRSGRVYMRFSRVSTSLKDAILSAIHDVRRANIGANVLRIDICNLVTQAEIARRADRSRAIISAYISGKRGPGNFPPPVCNICEEAPLWWWCEVSNWLWENGIIKEEVVREAQEIDLINNILELTYQKQIEPDLAEEIMQSLTPS